MLDNYEVVHLSWLERRISDRKVAGTMFILGHYTVKSLGKTPKATFLTDTFVW